MSGSPSIGVTIYDRLRHLDEVLWDTPPAPVNVLWWVIAGLTGCRYRHGLDHPNRATGEASMASLAGAADPARASGHGAWWRFGLIARIVDLVRVPVHSIVRPDPHDGR